MTSERLTILINKYLSDTATPEEEQELTAWYQAANEQEVQWPVADETEAAALKARLLSNLQTAIHPAANVRSIPFYRQTRWQVAAAILILISAGSWLWFKQSSNTNPVISKTTATPAEIVPGGDKAVLTLSDGRKIVLDSAGNTTLAQQGSTKVIKLNNGQLAYNTTASNASTTVLYNKISTPKGGQYEVILPDGSHVWLNAASSLRFATTFTGNERNVELTGEAYFEVAKDATKPFKVHFTTSTEGKDGVVEVLGTHFNINAYDDEVNTRTTLLEGSVRVSPAQSSPLEARSSKILTPGQQASISSQSNQSTTIQVQTVDTEEVIAWKNGKFQFNQADIKTVMRQIARWYDVEVEYEGPLSKEKFEGEIPRNSSLTDVFRILELSSVHFKTEGRKVIVMP
ncbi:MAG: FecR domain-containing protein [Niastella sp.]|nr:FecR domain-containing protein [Niastella sp.]